MGTLLQISAKVSLVTPRSNFFSRSVGYTRAQTDRLTDRPADRQTGRQTDRLTDRPALRKTLPVHEVYFLALQAQSSPAYVMFTTSNYSVSTETLNSQNFKQLQSRSSY